MKRISRKPSKLSDSVYRQLNMYALAATAAGVGVLTPAQASAKVIYTPAYQTLGPRGSLKLSLTHDGATDFVLQDLFQTHSNLWGSATFSAKPAKGNGIVGHHYASALNAGARVSRDRRFSGPVIAYVHWDADLGYYYLGNWINVGSHYLGIKLRIKGENHYGWARLSVKVQGLHIYPALTGYAYETIPNKPIIAGKTKGQDVIAVEPDSLGTFAAGTAGHRGRSH